MVVIKDEQHTKNNDDDYLSRKSVGKVDLNIWEQDYSSLYNASGSTAKVKSPQVSGRCMHSSASIIDRHQKERSMMHEGRIFWVFSSQEESEVCFTE